MIKLDTLPELPGIYKFLNDDHDIIYVGKAKNLKRRVSSYFNKTHDNPKTRELAKNVTDIDIIITSDEYSALVLENDLIKQHWPKYNIALKDDKSYPFITTNPNHKYPRLDYHVGAKTQACDYIGPYTDKSALKSMLKEVQKMFKIRSCSDYIFSKGKACLLHQIGHCSAPCENKISVSDYLAQYKLAMLFLNGDHKTLIDKWQLEMHKASKVQNYEQATLYRDLIKKYRKLSGTNLDKDSLDIAILARHADQIILLWIWVRDGIVKAKKDFKVTNPINENDHTVLETLVAQMLTGMPGRLGFPKKILVDLPDNNWANISMLIGNKKIIKESSKNPNMQKWLEIAQQNMQQTLKKIDVKWAETIYNDPEIQALTRLQSPPKITECFDISHTSGKQVYASCVVFDVNGPNKNLYRTYKIPFEDKPDDYKSLEYVLSNRYSDPNKVPDLIIVDGGKGQLGVLLKVLDYLNISNVSVLAISKGPGRREGLEMLHSREKTDVRLSPYNQALYSLLFIRNEAHRFALKQHRRSRQKNNIKFILETIPGISSHKRQLLYSHFGGLDGVKAASVNELIKVPTIGKKLAEKIVLYFKEI